MTIEYRDKNANGAVLLFSSQDQAEALKKIRSVESGLSVLTEPAPMAGNLLAIRVIATTGTIEAALDKIEAQPLSMQPVTDAAGSTKADAQSIADLIPKDEDEDVEVDVAVAVAADRALTGL